MSKKNPTLGTQFAKFLLSATAFIIPSQAFAESTGNTPFGALQIIQIAMLLGSMSAAILSATWLIRERRKLVHQLGLSQARISDLTASIERSDVMLIQKNHTIVVFETVDQEPRVIGTLPTKSGAPVEQAEFLQFNNWLSPASTKTLYDCIKKLYEKGVLFEKTLETKTGTQIEAFGRKAGSASFIRFMDLSSIKTENVILKQNIENFNHSNQLIDSLLEKLDFPVWRRDDAGILIYTNAAYNKLLQSDGAIVASGSNELFDKQARELIMHKRDEMGCFNGHVSTVINADRAVFNVVDITTASGSIGLARNVSELDAVREEFERTLRSQSDTLNQLTTAVAIFDKNQKLRSFNNAFQKLWNLDVAFLETQPEHGIILDLLRTNGTLPEQSEWRRWREQILSAYRAPEGTEDWWHLPDGKSLRVLGNPQPKGGMIWVFENMTEKFDLESRYNTLIKIQGETLDNLVEGVAVFGSDGKIRLSNPAFATLWNLSTELSSEGVHISKIARNCKDSAPNGEWNLFVGCATGFEDARNARQGQIELQSGKVLAYALVPLPKGQTMLTFIDVSDTVHIERVLKDRNDALHRADRLKNDFIQHVSYELRSPLTNIIGFTELLMQPTTGALSPRQSDYLDHISVSSSALLTTVNDILDLASVDAGIMDLEIVDIDIASLFSTLQTSFQHKLGENALNLVTQVEQGAETIMADAQRLRQIMGNLLSNAVHFAPHSSTITLRATHTESYIILSVHDEGKGIRNELLESVFERFVSHPSDQKRGGVGLGLSIVKGLVELHHGSVTVTSQPQTGTLVECFFEKIPTHMRAAAE
jgi:signal transduction histidine kinase/PAS domain-containing protein